VDLSKKEDQERSLEWRLAQTQKRADRMQEALVKIQSLGNDPDNAPMPMHRVMQIVHEALNP